MKAKERRCKNWLKSLATLVEETEAPRHYWLWSGIFTIGASLQRKVWLPFGLDPIYPNMYILLVGPPGKCRKGGPLSLAKKMLEEIKINVGVDSQSKRALTKELAETAKTGYFEYQGKPKTQCALALISKELSSLLAVDPKGMIEVLTDLYDSHDTWTYKTAGVGTDYLYNVCVCCFLGSTPGWISTNLPEEALTGGWSSRVAVVSANEKYKRISLPPLPSEELYQDLLHDLGIISNLVGEFQWGDGAYKIFDQWYQKLDLKYLEVKDERLHSFLERIHVMVLKVAMALRVAYSNELLLTSDDIGRSIDLLEEVLATASLAFFGQGRSRTSFEVERVLTQLRTLGKTTFKELLQMNYRNTNKTELKEVLDTIVAMGVVVPIYSNDGGVVYKWKRKGEKEK